MNVRLPEGPTYKKQAPALSDIPEDIDDMPNHNKHTWAKKRKISFLELLRKE